MSPPDLEALFGLSVNPFELVIRGTLIYLGLILLFRFVLRRDFGQLGVADVLFIVLIADAAQNGMAGEYRTIADAVVLLGTLALWNLALDWASYRFKPVRKLFEAPPVELVKDGRILRHNLRRQWVTVEELMSKVREQGVTDLARIKRAVLEPDGEFSIVQDPEVASSKPRHSRNTPP